MPNARHAIAPRARLVRRSFTRADHPIIAAVPDAGMMPSPN
jgi:hypothetical protein